MTPERANFWSERVIHTLGSNGGPSAGDVILAACAEERRAALTEAIDVCIKEGLYPDTPYPYDDACSVCTTKIIALRDKSE